MNVVLSGKHDTTYGRYNGCRLLDATSLRVSERGSIYLSNKE